MVVSTSDQKRGTAKEGKRTEGLDLTRGRDPPNEGLSQQSITDMVIF